MKIAFFSDCYLDLTGGIVTSINAQKQALEALGHEVVIFTTAYPKTSEQLKKLAREHIYVVPSCRFLVRGVTPISRRPRIIEKWLLREHPEIKDYDIFYVHYEAGCSIAGLRLGKKLIIPTVQVMHGREDMGVASIVPFGFRTITATLLNWLHSWYIPHPIKIHRDDYLADTIAKAKMWTMMASHANYADYVVCPSHHFAKKLTRYGVKKHIYIVPNGYRDAIFPTNPPQRILTPGEPLRLIWHSRLSGEKRILPFLQALTKVTGKCHLDIYGDGPDFKKAQRFARRHHLSAIFHGNVEFAKFQAALQKAHLDILASYNFDNYPLTLVEAEAYGLPVFICDPDMQEIVPKGGFILSKSESPTDMAATLNDLLTHPKKISQMSKTMLTHRDEVLISHRIKPLEQLFSGIMKL